MSPELKIHPATDDIADHPDESAERPAAPTASAPPLLIDREELARLLSVAVATLDRLRAAGRVPTPIRLGGSVRWHLAEVSCWLGRRGPDGGLLTAASWAKIRDRAMRGA